NKVLYAVGGYNGGPINTVEAYDPATNTWTTKAPMPTRRYELAVGIVNKILYAVGGSIGTVQTAVNTVEAYNPATNTWRAKARLPSRTAFPTIGVVNNVLYAAGGIKPGQIVNTVEAFTP
ncbi:MAG TPA: kelch repeat-containing protein, partial [Candidatus Eremiobacteraceae bacterium]|nr:kelch repeat-containing protein [Candidatus Eremiobacteraceae bacterium]